MEPAYRIEATIAEDGTIQLQDLPFRAGERVEVILIPCVQAEHAGSAAPLRGSVLRYEGPYEPVAEEEWEASR